MSGRNLVLELHCLAPGRGGSSSSRSQRAQGGGRLAAQGRTTARPLTSLAVASATPVPRRQRAREDHTLQRLPCPQGVEGVVHRCPAK
jgi:hypothetical protein